MLSMFAVIYNHLWSWIVCITMTITIVQLCNCVAFWVSYRRTSISCYYSRHIVFTVQPKELDFRIRYDHDIKTPTNDVKTRKPTQVSAPWEFFRTWMIKYHFSPVFGHHMCCWCCCCCCCCCCNTEKLGERGTGNVGHGTWDIGHGYGLEKPTPWSGVKILDIPIMYLTEGAAGSGIIWCIKVVEVKYHCIPISLICWGLRLLQFCSPQWAKVE